MPKPAGGHHDSVPNNEEEKERPSGSWPRGGAEPEPAREGEDPVPLSDAEVSMRYGGGDLIDGKYRLVRRLGEGGMGEVWLAHNETLDIDVAVKLIRADAEKGEHGDRLLREARAAARLGHPAIVRIFDFGKTQYDDPFIVMELLEGEDLATALERRGRLSAIKAVRTILPIIHALSAAHTKGIIHRDIKPENIYLQLTEDDQLQPKLVDFGIAKLDRSKALRITQTGALLGSPLYMCPEQARGDDVDHRGDIWSICVVLYEMICGRPPFEGKNYNAILYSIIANEPPPSTQLSAGDEALWAILEKAFEKDPDRRPQTMRELGEALALWLFQRSVSEDITGASIETAWLQRSTRDRMDALSTVAPPPPGGNAPGPVVQREAVTTRIVAPRGRSLNRSSLVALGAGALAAGLGMTLWLSSGDDRAAEKRQAAPPAPESTSTAKADRPPEESAPGQPAEAAKVVVDEDPPIPVEALEKAPPDSEADREDQKKTKSGAEAPAPDKTAVAKPPPRRRVRPTPRKPARRSPPPEPAPALKDPFQ